MQPPLPRAAAPDRRQRNIVIGLSVASVLVLLAGVIAFVATRDSGSSSTPASSPSVTSAPTTVPDTTTTSSTTTTSTTTTMPVVVGADAGPDVDASAGEVVTLDAIDVGVGVAPEDVRWVQRSGPDVTAGVGALGGATVSFGAPNAVATLEFDLEVIGTDDQVAVDSLVVRVFEDLDASAFVDGELGDDEVADGTREAPFRTLAWAAERMQGADLYVRSVGTYDESRFTIELRDDMSIYGGFDEEWNRDPADRAVIVGAPSAIRVTGEGDRWLSAIDVTASDAEVDEPSIAIVVDGGDVIRIEDSRVLGGGAGADADGDGGAVSVGVFVDRADEIRIERSTVNSGVGGAGAVGGTPDVDPDSGGAGDDAEGREAGDGAPGDGVRAGGDGGRGGETSDGEPAPDGGPGGTTGSRNGGTGTGGVGGAGGVGGDGGDGVVEDAPVVPIGSTGSPGASSSLGAGGSGGGGGFGPLLVEGGGGGGGGAGGAGAPGGAAGTGGGGSIGIWSIDVDRLVISESLVAGGAGGVGGPGGAGVAGGAGGPGGDGAPGVDGVLADGGDGGGAGGGGAGGVGGQGGGGAGGPSYGLLTRDVDVVEVAFSTIRGGGGGAGADGGVGGAAGAPGGNGSGRSGGSGGLGAVGDAATGGVGASGGSSYGWFDESGADQRFDEAEFIEGTAGPGGRGSEPGAAGAEVASNV